MKNVLLIAAAVIAVLALAILVPSSPALMVDTPTVLWSSGGVDEWGNFAGVPLTAYGVMIAVGAALAIGSTVAIRGSRGKAPVSGIALALTSGGFALVCSHLLFCVLRWGYIINDLCETPAYLVQFWKGGYTMYGAILGGLLGAAVYAKAKKESVADAIGAIVPGMTILLTLGRAAEGFTGQGMGTYVVNEALGMLPFVQANEWGEMQLPVYVYEALIAAAALVTTVVMLLRRKATLGQIAETGLAIISAGQVMMDSWRGDELIRFGFVRLNMICAAVTLLAIILLRVRRCVKQDGWKVWSWLRIVLLFAFAGVVIAIEFALDKSNINNTLLYAVMTVCVVGMGAVTLADGKRA